MGCAPQSGANCTANCQSHPHGKAKIPYDALPHNESATEHPTPLGPNPFEDAEPADAEKPQDSPMPMPMRKQEEKPQPLPDPPMEDDSAQRTENPFMRVAQTQEWDASATVPVSHVPHRTESPETDNASDFTEKQPYRRSTYSKPWADALGLSSRGE